MYRLESMARYLKGWILHWHNWAISERERELSNNLITVTCSQVTKFTLRIESLLLSGQYHQIELLPFFSDKDNNWPLDQTKKTCQDQTRVVQLLVGWAAKPRQEPVFSSYLCRGIKGRRLISSSLFFPCRSKQLRGQCHHASSVDCGKQAVCNLRRRRREDGGKWRRKSAEVKQFSAKKILVGESTRLTLDLTGNSFVPSLFTRRYVVNVSLELHLFLLFGVNPITINNCYLSKTPFLWLQGEEDFEEGKDLQNFLGVPHRKVSKKSEEPSVQFCENPSVVFLFFPSFLVKWQGRRFII